MLTTKELGYILITISVALIIYTIVSLLGNEKKEEKEEVEEAKEEQAEEKDEEKPIFVEKKRVKYKYLNPDDSVAIAIKLYPQLEDFLYYNGVRAIRNKVVKDAFAKRTTLENVARALGKDVDEFMSALNKYIDETLKA